MRTSSSLLMRESGHFCTSSRAGRQIKPNTTSAANGFKNMAMTTEPIPKEYHANR